MKRSNFRLLPVALAALFTFLFNGPAISGIPPVTDSGGIPTFAPVLEQVTPAVVNIAVLSRSPEHDNPMLRDPIFRRYFGLPERSRPQLSAGFGVMVASLPASTARNGQALAELQGATIGTVEGGSQADKVVVMAVQRGGPAHAHGLREGDVILAVNRKPVVPANS